MEKRAPIPTWKRKGILGSKKFSKFFVHMLSAKPSFSFLPYVSAVIAFLVCAGM
jgi:hypothetical protein